jgi:riboflavin kinase/FMN adenylyltransferase
LYIVERIKKVHPFFGNTSLTIGNFEGFHRGHAQIVRTLVEESRKRGLFSTVITFKRHPLVVLKGKEPQKLWAPCDKILKFKEVGIDLIIYVDFSPQFSSTKPLDFLTEIRENIGPRLLCLGSSFRFGRNNEGDMILLKRLESRFHFEVVAVDDVEEGGEVVSSTRIRKSIKKGDFRVVNELLGRRYSVYLVPDREQNSLMLPFLTNMAVPEHGHYGGELHNFKNGNKSIASFRIEKDRFIPLRDEKFESKDLYTFYFDAI